MDHSTKTHNGEITIRNPATGQHRTVRVKTQKEDAKFAPGERIISLLSGPNNDSDYIPFGFVKWDGRVIVWKRFRGNGQRSFHERLALMVMYPDHYEEHCDVEYRFDTTCRKCNRKLTTPESIDSGIGPVCAGKQ
jgi:hypothetical protein